MSNTTLFEGLQTDIRNLSQEIRKKHPNIKEVKKSLKRES